MTEFKVYELIDNMCLELRHMLGATISQANIMGIQTGGVWIAEQIHKQLANPNPLGSLNITFYRDDFSRIGLHPQVEPSDLPFSVDDKTIILVDDVLHSGRTIRAALNEIFDYGRPARVVLAILVDRKGHELPIQADVCGMELDLKEDEQIKLKKSAKLRLVLEKTT